VLPETKSTQLSVISGWSEIQDFFKINYQKNWDFKR